MQSHPTIAYIAIGANLGDRKQNIDVAIDRINHIPRTRVIIASKLIENPAVGGPAGSPDFLNGVIEIQTTLRPHELLQELLEIEKTIGRERRAKWEPRVIDLDLLLYGDQVISSDNLTVPHPLMHTRRFVLEPLAQIAPNLLHPTIRVAIKSLLERLS